MKVLETHGLNIGYGKRTVLSDINLAVCKGTLTTLIGANGSGKSTLLRTLAGAQPPLSGSILFGGRAIEQLRRPELAKSLAMVFTDRTGGGGLSVEETVEIGRQPYTGLFGRLSEKDRKIVHESIEAVGMGGMKSRLCGTLSDGERQKVMIARALAQDTPLIILDEPTAFLDVAGRIEITALLRSLADSGKAIVLSTHDISSAIAVADSLWIVDKTAGRLIEAPRDTAIEQGLLDKAFPGLHFDKTSYSFIL